MTSYNGNGSNQYPPNMQQQLMQAMIMAGQHAPQSHAQSMGYGSSAPISARAMMYGRQQPMMHYGAGSGMPMTALQATTSLLSSARESAIGQSTISAASLQNQNVVMQNRNNGNFKTGSPSNFLNNSGNELTSRTADGNNSVETVKKNDGQNCGVSLSSPPNWKPSQSSFPLPRANDDDLWDRDSNDDDDMPSRVYTVPSILSSLKSYSSTWSNLSSHIQSSASTFSSTRNSEERIKESIKRTRQNFSYAIYRNDIHMTTDTSITGRYNKTSTKLLPYGFIPSTEEAVRKGVYQTVKPWYERDDPPDVSSTGNIGCATVSPTGMDAFPSARVDDTSTSVTTTGGAFVNLNSAGSVSASAPFSSLGAMGMVGQYAPLAPNGIPPNPSGLSPSAYPSFPGGSLGNNLLSAASGTRAAILASITGSVHPVVSTNVQPRESTKKRKKATDIVNSTSKTTKRNKSKKYNGSRDSENNNFLFDSIKMEEEYATNYEQDSGNNHYSANGKDYGQGDCKVESEEKKKGSDGASGEESDTLSVGMKEDIDCEEASQLDEGDVMKMRRSRRQKKTLI